MKTTVLAIFAQNSGNLWLISPLYKPFKKEGKDKK